MAGRTSSEEASLVLGSDLSVEAGVPFNYLSKILGVLSKAGLLQGSRGRGGGYRLSRPADQIPLIDVIELFDGIKAKPDCLLGDGRTCSDDNSCTAHESFKKVRQVYIEFLETTTISDIAGTT
jgi:Rrf2 family protein